MYGWVTCWKHDSLNGWLDIWNFNKSTNHLLYNKHPEGLQTSGRIDWLTDWQKNENKVVYWLLVIWRAIWQFSKCNLRTFTNSYFYFSSIRGNAKYISKDIFFKGKDTTSNQRKNYRNTCRYIFSSNGFFSSGFNSLWASLFFVC